MAEDVAPNKEQPLSGVILCCTSILPELRTQLAATATQMGALHKFDLTSEVTHLIVGETNTPKYKYVAKERLDVKVLRAEWVEAVRSSWMLGGDTDLQALEEEYRFPPFAGLSICLTGFEDMDFRSQLQEHLTANGAEFRRDLTKSVTHLLARTAEGQKYKFATRWNVKIVSLKWFEDSLERGMILEESLYEPSLPAQKQGIGAWNRVAPTNLEKRVKPSSAGSQRPRKLRRVASTKLGDQNEGIWTDIVGNDGAAVDHGSDFNSAVQPAHGQSSASVKPAIQEAKSFASETTLFERPKSITQDTAPLTLPGSEEQRRGIWHESTFLIHGFPSDRIEILESLLFSHEAKVVASVQDLLGSDSNGGTSKYILVPYNLQRSEFPPVDEDIEPEPEIVTDMWIERCLSSNTFVPPESQITSTPVPRFPIPAFEGMTICSTGFVGIEVLHLSKLVTLMGATYSEYLTANASVLVCRHMQPNRDKLSHVNSWNVPAVIADWLWISIQTGEKKPFEPYIIRYRSSGSKGSGKKEDDDKHSKPPPPQTEGQSVGQKRVNGDIPLRPEASSNRPDGHALQEVSPNSPRKPSRSPSPAKAQHATPAPNDIPPGRSDRPDATEPRMSEPLELAISDLLKQKRSGPKPNNTTDKDPGSRPQRRRQLLGRASSNSSTLAAAGNNPAQLHRGASRASSIDTMNEDGYGIVVDGLDSSSTKANSNAPSSISGPTTTAKNEDQSEAQQLLENRLNFLRTHTMFNEFAGPEGAELAGQDDDSPEMTQLGYEDPDAAAMREKIMQHAEKLNEGGGDSGSASKARGAEKNNSDSGRNLVIGRLQDHELLAGWGGGRRTRSSKDGPGRR